MLEYKQAPTLTVHGAPLSTTVHRDKWLCEAALWCKWAHVGTAEAVSSCELLRINVQSFTQGLQSNHLIFGIAAEYSKQFHRRLSSAHPPLAPWPTDLEVPFTDYCDLVVSMPVEIQEVIGQATLTQSKLSKPQLKDEVRNGTSIVVTTGEGKVFRVVSLVVLRIERADGRVFAQVGKWKNSLASPSCQLPGAKQLRNELNPESVERIFKSKVPWFCDKVDMVDTQRETTEKMSSEYGIQTRYLRTICTGRLKAAEDHEELAQELNIMRPRTSFTAANAQLEGRQVEPVHAVKCEALLREEMLAVWDGDTASLYAWLFPQDFEYLTSIAGAPVLETWLSLMDPPVKPKSELCSSLFSSSQHEVFEAPAGEPSAQSAVCTALADSDPMGFSFKYDGMCRVAV